MKRLRPTFVVGLGTVMMALAGCETLNGGAGSPVAAANTELDTSPPFASELAAARHYIKPLFHVLDCEGKDEIDPGEVDEHFSQIFFYIDRNLDKKITKEELISSAHNSSAAKETYLFNRMDVNGDGSVSAREIRNYTIEAIDMADTNQDGTVLPDEIEQP